jgi:hypothetical protein
MAFNGSFLIFLFVNFGFLYIWGLLSHGRFSRVDPTTSFLAKCYYNEAYRYYRYDRKHWKYKHVLG